ncbi:MAG: (2Fe-2S)-binding protein [Phycisphaerae bacterium]|jgi:bacterioferritin-associated ferredoxin|nr:(2Fe-2S)-binding protein [Phycisphaerae bacterium]MBT6269461.1 (2Fe-2S)-binding protein [Phycisphaerae bacterium]
MNKDDNVCVCHKVSLGKLQSFLKRENPIVASQLSDCVEAGTSCGWCIPFLKQMHEQHTQGTYFELGLDSDAYLTQRKEYIKQKKTKKQQDG